jgi:hypothetical protein
MNHVGAGKARLPAPTNELFPLACVRGSPKPRSAPPVVRGSPDPAPLLIRLLAAPISRRAVVTDNRLITA